MIRIVRKKKKKRGMYRNKLWHFCSAGNVFPTRATGFECWEIVAPPVFMRSLVQLFARTHANSTPISLAHLRACTSKISQPLPLNDGKWKKNLKACTFNNDRNYLYEDFLRIFCPSRILVLLFAMKTSRSITRKTIDFFSNKIDSIANTSNSDK